MNLDPKLQTALWTHLFIIGLLSLSFCSRSPAKTPMEEEHLDRIGSQVAHFVHDKTFRRIGKPKVRKELAGLWDCETLPLSRNSLTVEFDCEWYIRVVSITEEESK